LPNFPALLGRAIYILEIFQRANTLPRRVGNPASLLAWISGVVSFIGKYKREIK